MTTASEMSLWLECSGNPLDRDSEAELADLPPAESFTYATVINSVRAFADCGVSYKSRPTTSQTT